MRKNLVHTSIQNKISESELNDDYDIKDLFLTIKDFLCDILFTSNVILLCETFFNNKRHESLLHLKSMTVCHQNVIE